MLRVAVPYGALNSAQVRKLAYVARTYDKGYAHISTRQNVQFNWPELEQCPQILADLAEVQMHAVQTSGNCIRNTTTDEYAGVIAEEIVDPRPYCEIIRQWSTFHPEFAFLPRKFKIAVNAVPGQDRAAITMHDIGINIVKNDAGEIGYRVLVGGGLGRTPILGEEICAFLPEEDLLTYLDATIRVYNQFGRRDNKYKARIKITVHENGIDAIRDRVNTLFDRIRPTFSGFDQARLEEIETAFAAPALRDAALTEFETAYDLDPVFRSWADTNLVPHHNADHAIVSISLKAHGATPGDASSDQMRVMAGLAERFGHDELRISHEQNVILPHVHKSDLPALHASLKEAGLATANIGLISDIIACPGMDYCALATARSIPIAQEIATRFDELKIENDIGPLKIKISGCINACGHHHVGHIGILGLEKAGVEFYQVKLGGDASETAEIGQVTGPGFSQTELIDGIERIMDFYLETRDEGERFIDTFRRIGMTPFKEVLYDHA